MPTLPQAFGITRVAVGIISWIAPTQASRVFGLDPHSRQPVVTQLFGARDIALGALTATASGSALRQVLAVGVAIDAADTIASARQARAGTLSAHGIVGVGVGAAFFTGLGVAALRAAPAARSA